MIIAYTRTYSNKQQSDNQKNAIEQFAANNNIIIDKWHNPYNLLTTQEQA